MRRAIFLLVLAILTSEAPAIAEYRVSKVVLDAGHGGSDRGAGNPFGGPVEKELVLDLVRRVEKGLKARGLEVVMTRDSDVFVPLGERAAAANQAKADLFVSLHANASPSSALRGFEVYYLSEAADDMALARERSGGAWLETILWDLRQSQNRRDSRLAGEAVMGAIHQAKVSPVQRLRSANFQVLRKTEMPAVLVEAGYLTNRQDQRQLRSTIHRARLAEAIVEGLWEFKRSFESTDGFTQ